MRILRHAFAEGLDGNALGRRGEVAQRTHRSLGDDPPAESDEAQGEWSAEEDAVTQLSQPWIRPWKSMPAKTAKPRS